MAVEIPTEFMDVRYDAARHPGARGVSGLAGGANCQRFAYALLRHNGRTVPDLRSSELWTDTERSIAVTRLEPLDLLLFNRTPDAFGAQVAVYLGDDQAIHLCKSVGKPAIWTLAEFAARPEYRCFIGAKRARA